MKRGRVLSLLRGYVFSVSAVVSQNFQFHCAWLFGGALESRVSHCVSRAKVERIGVALGECACFYALTDGQGISRRKKGARFTWPKLHARAQSRIEQRQQFYGRAGFDEHVEPLF